MRSAEPPAAPRAAEPAPALAKKDPIAALLNGEGVVEPSAPPARVTAVQKALIKTGFVLRADGVMGATTRQALERFEQDRKLPVTGDLSPRTLRELAAQSGVAIP
jgi:peptidoglycan hydrolase-like protein with peptidoglycan-binding domain